MKNIYLIFAYLNLIIALLAKHFNESAIFAGAVTSVALLFIIAIVHKYLLKL